MEPGWTAEEERDFRKWLAELEAREDTIDDVEAYHDLIDSDFELPPRGRRFMFRVRRLLRRLRDLPREVRSK